MKKIKPHKIRLEASSLCQLQCPCCTTASGEIKKGIGYGYLKAVHFKKLIDENPFIKAADISNFGEIFLNPELPDIIRYAHEKDIQLTADNGVNLNTVTDEVLECLVKNRFYRISVSIDGASQETYEQYRVKGHFDTVIENIRKINRYKQKRRTPFPYLMWQFVIFGHNEHELPAAKKLATELDMTFHPKLSWDRDFSPVKNPEFIKKETGLTATDRSEYKKNTGKNYAAAICHQMWEEPQINWDGRVFGCCINYWKAYTGNVFTDGLLPTLNSEMILYARDMLLGKKPSRKDIPCSTCDLYRDYCKDNRWLKRGFSRVLFRIARYWYKRLRLKRWL